MKFEEKESLKKFPNFNKIQAYDLCDVGACNTGHRLCKDHGFQSRWRMIFFLGIPWNCLSCCKIVNIYFFFQNNNRTQQGIKCVFFTSSPPGKFTEESSKTESSLEKVSTFHLLCPTFIKKTVTSNNYCLLASF